MKSSRTLRTFVTSCALALAIAPAAFAQDNTNTSTSAARATVAAGQKTKLVGSVVSSNGNSFVVQDASGTQTTVTVSDRTSIKTKGGFLGGGTKYAASTITRGLSVEVEGRGDSSGNVVADKVRFTDADLRAARTLEANIVPVESRV